MDNNKSPYRRILLVVIVFALTIISCGQFNTSTPVPLNEADLRTSAVQTSLAENNDSTPINIPEGTSLPEVENISPTATLGAHLTTPGEPGNIVSWITDSSSLLLANESRSSFENFSANQLERPFTSEIMDYQAHIDIIGVELSLSAPWVYISFTLEGTPPTDSQTYYGVEIDLDIDGRGDWLISGLVPPSTDWTTDGVRAYSDTNNDVGGNTPMFSESLDPNRDGYDDLVFDSGYGDDIDTAWIRRDPSNSKRVQLAFKYSLIGSDAEFLWGAWADEGVNEAAWFDYNDHFTLEEAGSPLSNSAQYPLLALAQVDNTCRWGVGFQPTGNEPGACIIPATPTPTPPPCDWNGTWIIWIDGATMGVPMSTTQTGDSLYAEYIDGGMNWEVNGIVSEDGCTATGTAGDAGFPPIWSFTWIMQPNLNQFIGNHNVMDYWCGARNGALQPAPCLGP